MANALREYLKKYGSEYLVELRDLLEAKGFAVTSMSPGIGFYKRSEVDPVTHTYPEYASYNLNDKHARLLYELLREKDEK